MTRTVTAQILMGGDADPQVVREWQISPEDANYVRWYFGGGGPGIWNGEGRMWSERDQWTFWREYCRVHEQQPGPRSEHRRNAWSKKP